MLMIVAALLLAAPETPTGANVTAPAAEPTPAAAEPVKPKLVCRRGQPTNSLVPTRKTCLTAEEWAKRDGVAKRSGSRS